MRNLTYFSERLSLHLTVLGEEVDLEGFDLANDRAVVAICRKGKKKTRIALESVDFQWGELW